MSEFEKKDLEFAVKTARGVIEKWVRKKERLDIKECPDGFKQKRGIFVTVYSFPEKELRGCIGYPEPVMPLIQAVIDSAIEATQDPRFEPVKPEELDKIIIEVSVLTKPEEIKVENPLEYPEKIKIGTDGLIIRKGFQSGLLLPKVPVEYGWDAKEFLEHLCMKAGLPPDQWVDEPVRIYRFRAITHEEKSPGVA